MTTPPRPPGRVITIEDVARAANVSVSTVSRILNNKPDVAERTRQRVNRIIEELGYSPHTQAKNLAAGRSHTIALLFPIEHTSVTQLELDFFVGAAQAAGEHGYSFNLMTIPATENNLLNLYRSGKVDGIILMQIKLEDWRVNLLVEQGHPFVMIGRTEDTTGLNFIDLDFEAAMALAVEQFWQAGHRHMALLTRPHTMYEQGLGAAVRFLRGYTAACQRLGVEAVYREVDLTVEAMQQATLDLLAEHPQTSALVTVNGVTAAGVLRALQQTGRSVPQDCSVIAIATNRIAQIFQPPLTSIDFPTERIGYQAAMLLIDQIENRPDRAEQILLQPELVTRESTAVRP